MFEQQLLPLTPADNLAMVFVSHSSGKFCSLSSTTRMLSPRDLPAVAESESLSDSLDLKRKSVRHQHCIASDAADSVHSQDT